MNETQRAESKKQRASKGPGRVRDGLEPRQHELYLMARFCGLVNDVRTILALARGEVSPMAARLRELARDYGRQAREIHLELFGEGVAA